MRNIKRAACLLMIIIACEVFALAKDPILVDQYINRKFWLKHPLIFLDEASLPTVYPDNLVFTHRCTVNAYAGRILGRGTEITIVSMRKEKRFTKVTFSVGKAEYQLLTFGHSDRVFRKSFNLVFAENDTGKEPDWGCANDMKTKRQVIDCLGFPISVCKTGQIEKLFYILEFVGFDLFSYDGWEVKIKNGKVVEISGYI